MEKIEIEVPNGKIADITKDSDKVIITFKENLLGDISSVKNYINKLADSKVKWACDLWKEYTMSKYNSYSQKICLYRMVVAALTNNEERHLITGKQWYPFVQFCELGKENNCSGNKIIGTIELEGKKYTVVGGHAANGGHAGLGCFNSYYGVADSYAHVGFRSVSSKEVAEHISKYFGRLLFDIHYGGVNCNWRWID